MAFTNEQFVRTRPYLFHLTNRDDVAHIRDARVLHSAAELMQQAGNSSFLQRKRTNSVELRIDNRLVKLRDQQPLYPGNITFEGGTTFQEVIESLNERVFFWPGKSAGPIEHGRRHFERYVDEQPVILRVSTAAILNLNRRAIVQFSRYNSGSPRCSRGLGSPRGPNTFVASLNATFTAGKVVEVTFLDRVSLPAEVSMGDSVNGPWQSLYGHPVSDRV